MLVGVYLMVHNVTNCFYIGSTRDLRRRKNNHLHALRKGIHTNPKLQQCFNHSPEFHWDFIPTETLDDAIKLEYEYISKYFGNPLLCNDKHIDNSGRLTTSAANKENISKGKLGSKHSDETKALMSSQRRGKLKDRTWRDNIGKANGIKVEVMGVVYDSAHIAGTALGENPSTVLNRARNPNPKYKDWKIVE